jgi:hypothetical protein
MYLYYYACYMSHPSPPPLLDLNYNCWCTSRVQIFNPLRYYQQNVTSEMASYNVTSVKSTLVCFDVLSETVVRSCWAGNDVFCLLEGKDQLQ